MNVKFDKPFKVKNMSDFTLTSSDHILAQGVKFWTSVVEDHQIEELDQCYQIITALGEFLTTLNSPVYKETLDTMENEDGEKDTNIQSFPASVLKNDDPVKTDDQQDENQSSNYEKDEKTNIEDIEELLKLDQHPIEDKIGDNDKDSDDDLDDLFSVIECSEDLLVDNVFPGENYQDQEETHFPEIKKEAMKTEEKGGGEKKITSCDYCEDTFPSFRNLITHISSDHHGLVEEFREGYKVRKKKNVCKNTYLGLDPPPPALVWKNTTYFF